MSSFEILAAIGIASAAVVLIYIAIGSPRTGSVALATVLGIGFAAFTMTTVANEGLDVLWANHTVNMWGVQVWWDLLLSVGIALFFVAPRARKAEMRIAPWAMFIAMTASIGLLFMVARLFWLEHHLVDQT